MNPVMARMVALTTAVLLAGTLAAVYITSHPGASGTTVRAEFDDVYPLLPGMHVRVDGAIAGSVGEIVITDQGTALVSLELFEGTAHRAPTRPPRSASRTSPATATWRSIRATIPSRSATR